MTPSGACYKLVRDAEGLRTTAYQDGAGVWTVGYGHTGGVRPRMICSAQQAEAWLEADMAEAAAGVNRIALPATQDQFDALVSFTFNEGIGHLAGSHLLHFHKAGASAAAAAEFSKWVYADGEIEAGLVRRRAAEARLYLGEA